MSWFEESWGYIVLGGGFVAASVALIKQTLSAERDRLALKNAVLEREKLELEVRGLRNSPEIVADRRTIYNRLRELLSDVVRDGDIKVEQLWALHEIHHDSHFRFPPDIVRSIWDLIESSVTLYATNRAIGRGPRRDEGAKWGEVVEKNANALNVVTEYMIGLTARFQPHLSL